uniref:F-BAR domain-containing protein n=1 Tax=Laticauda laticaudata TaxID=8630 RepID=A0A8C5SNX7_LATLA
SQRTKKISRKRFPHLQYKLLTTLLCFHLEIRAQLIEQQKCLEQQTEMRVQLLQDLQDFFRKKAEIETEYSRSLEKLAERFMAKTRNLTRYGEESMKDQNLLSPINCWYLLLNQVRRESKDHATLSDIYLNNVIMRFMQISEDSTRVFKKVMKTYHMYHTESISAESKLKEAEKQEEKQIGRSGDPVFHIRLEERHQRRSSVKKIEKMKEKRQAKYSENKLKSIKARNEYLLTLEATNASVFKYYIHDLSDLIDCCDLGYHASLNRALRTYLSAEYNLETSRHEGLDIIENAVDNLEPRNDKQRFMEMYPTAFCPPMKFEFQSHMGDEVSNSIVIALPSQSHNQNVSLEKPSTLMTTGCFSCLFSPISLLGASHSTTYHFTHSWPSFFLAKPHKVTAASNVLKPTDCLSQLHNFYLGC